MTSTELIENATKIADAKVDYPAFSFFFRIHSGSEKQLHDSAHIRNRVHEVLKESKLSTSELEDIKSRADRIIDDIQFDRGALSIGLFVSPNQSMLSQYFVNLPERHYVGEYFSGYETMYAEKESSPYLLFLLEPSSLRIYTGRAEHLQEIDESSATTHLVSVYRRRPTEQPDKDGKCRKGHHKNSEWKQEFLQAISDVCSDAKVPAFFSGLSLVELNEIDLASHGVEVLASKEETFHFVGSESLKEVVQDLRAAYQEKQAKSLIAQCTAAKGSRKLASGLDEVLSCAREGRGAVLVLPYPSWEMSGALELGQLHDAVRLTLLTSGTVEFLPSELMAQWNDAAMILRY